MSLSPPPQQNEFNYIWQKWLYDLWECWNTSAVVKIRTVTASDDAAIDFEDAKLFDGTYRKIEFIFTDIVPATDDEIFGARLKIDGAYKTSSYGYHVSTTLESASTYSGSSGAGSGRLVLATACGSADGEFVSGEFCVYNPTGSANHKGCTWDVVMYSEAAAWKGGTGRGGHDVNNSAVTGVRFLFDNGNITSGKITAYGIK